MIGVTTRIKLIGATLKGCYLVTFSTSKGITMFRLRSKNKVNQDQKTVIIKVYGEYQAVRSMTKDLIKVNGGYCA